MILLIESNTFWSKVWSVIVTLFELNPIIFILTAIWCIIVICAVIPIIKGLDYICKSGDFPGTIHTPWGDG